jgi:hypothetical protein
MIVPTFGGPEQRHEESQGRSDTQDNVRTGNRSNGGGGGGQRNTGDGQYPTLVVGALEELPDGPGWSEEEMQEWLDLFERVLRIVYKVPRSQAGNDR